MGLKKSNNEIVFTQNIKIDAVCIVVAAGFSSRMGSWKVELKTREGMNFLDNALSAASVCRETILVGGYRFNELQRRITTGFDGVIVENKDFSAGMLGTVQRALEEIHGYFFILPIDMPRITGGHLRSLFAIRDEQRVVRPTFNDIPGHPVLCPPEWREKLLNGHGKSPSAVIGKSEPVFVSWADDSVVMDVDTPEAYNAYLGRQE